DFAQSAASVQSVARVGRPSITHATAVGKVLLAFGDVELLPEPLTAYTERTVTRRDTLASQIEEVRSQGWAQALGEREDDLNALAAPVWDDRGRRTAIVGVQGPASLFPGAALDAPRPL